VSSVDRGVDSVELVEPVSKPADSRAALDVLQQVASHRCDSAPFGALTLALLARPLVRGSHRSTQVSLQHGQAFQVARVDGLQAAPHALDVAEDPRISQRPTSDHDGVHARLRAHVQGILCAADSAVAEYWNTHCFLDRGQQAEIHRSFVLLGTCASVNGDCAAASRLDRLADLHRVDLPVGPTCTDLRGDRQGNCIGDRANQPLYELRVAHQRSPLAPRNDAGYRATHVEVDQVASNILLYPAGGLCELIYVGSIELDPYWTLPGVSLDQANGSMDAAQQAIGGDEFGVHESAALLFAQQAEAQVSETRHGCKDRDLGDLDGTDLHGHRPR